MTPLPTARTPADVQSVSAAKNCAGEGCIINGEIVVLDLGTLRPVSPMRAWNEWFSVVGSPSPQCQARARVLRAALDQIGYLQ